MTAISNTDRVLALTLTVVVFLLAQKLNKKANGHPASNPVLISIASIAIILKLSGVSYSRYFEGAQFIHFLLGPAVVALAIPLYRNIRGIRDSGRIIFLSLGGGVAVGMVTVVVLCALFNADKALSLSLLTRSITAPVATALAKPIGGIPALAALFAVMAGVFGAAFGPALLNSLGIRRNEARGLAMGAASHGQGTARILQENEQAGAFAGLAMGLVAVVMAFLIPLLALL